MRFSPLGLLHVIVGFIGWGSYGTCLAGVCLIINGGVYIEATRRMEAGDGGRAVYEKVGLRFKRHFLYTGLLLVSYFMGSGALDRQL